MMTNTQNVQKSNWFQEKYIENMYYEYYKYYNTIDFIGYNSDFTPDVHKSTIENTITGLKEYENDKLCKAYYTKKMKNSDSSSSSQETNTYFDYLQKTEELIKYIVTKGFRIVSLIIVSSSILFISVVIFSQSK